MGRSRPAGFALITTMLMIVLVVMLVGSVVSSSLGDWRLAHSMLQRETALMAANSGTQYAFTRLQQDIYWRANPSQPYHLQGERYEIWESQGNVVGKLVAPYGETSFFRFKFNYEDGPGGADGLPDSQYPLPLELVSCNNLFNLVPQEVMGRPFNSTPAAAPLSEAYAIDPGLCSIIVEGLAGPAVQDLSLEEVASLTEGRAKTKRQTLQTRLLTRRFVERYFHLEALQLPPTPPRSAPPPPTNSSASALYASQSATLSDSSSPVHWAHFQSDSQALRPLKPSQVRQANRRAYTLADGHYVLRPGEKGYTLYRYPQREEYERRPQSGSPVMLPQTPSLARALSLGPLTIHSESPTLIISGDLRIATQDAQGSFSLSAEDAQGRPSRPRLLFNDCRLYAPAPALSAEALALEGPLLGRGLVNAQRFIHCQGALLSESDPRRGVSLYAGQGIEIGPAAHLTPQLRKLPPSLQPPGWSEAKKEQWREYRGRYGTLSPQTLDLQGAYYAGHTLSLKAGPKNQLIFKGLLLSAIEEGDPAASTQIDLQGAKVYRLGDRSGLRELLKSPATSLQATLYGIY